MKMMTLTKRILCIGLLVALAAPTAYASETSEEPTTTMSLEAFLVRHAEKQKGDDPALTEAGAERAEALADLLADANIEHILSSDYTRTRDTAAPLAARLNLTVELYDPRDLPGLVVRLKEAGGRYLIVGHSNTTPYLAHLLGGDHGGPITEATEYDRLYYIAREGDDVSSVLLRYGDPSPKAEK